MVKKNSSIVKFPDWKCLQLFLLLTWTKEGESALARAALKLPTQPDLLALPASFPERHSSSCVSAVMLWEDQGTQPGICQWRLRTPSSLLYFTWSYDNHEMALRILWISSLSNPCVLLFGYTSVSVLFFGKKCLMFRNLEVIYTTFFLPVQIEVRILSTTKRNKVKKSKLILQDQTHKLWLASDLG